MHDALDDWIRREAIACSADSPGSLDAAVDEVVASLGDSVELLGFGEALHGGEDILLLRNRLFHRLVEAHGYRAIVIESSFPKARVVNEYVAGRGPARYDDVEEHGFSHGFGRVEANRELVEWMRNYNADPSCRIELRFYGFDMPIGSVGYAGPSQVLRFAVDYLASIDAAIGEEHRRQIDPLLGEDADWDNPAAIADPTKSVGLSPAATALRIATEDLLTTFRTRRPDWVAGSSQDLYSEALQHAVAARELLNSHAALARQSGYAALLGLRDALMADHLEYVADRERGRGKVLAFAHNGHLQRGRIDFPMLGQWWPAGSHLDGTLGPRYAVIGSAVGLSEANGIGPPEAGTLEARLTALAGTTAFIPTHRGERLAAAEVATIPSRSASSKNPSYMPLNAQSLTDFDWLAVLDSTAYSRGARLL